MSAGCRPNALRDAGPAADPQGRRRCARLCFPDLRSSCRRSRRCRSAARLAIARIDEPFAVTVVRRLRAGASSCAASPSSRPTWSRSPSNSSACRISGAARPVLASTARRWCRLPLIACGIACPRDSDMQEASARHAAAAHVRSRRRCGAATWCSGRATSPSCATPTTLIHANAFHMAVAIEPIQAAIARASARLAATSSSLRRRLLNSHPSPPVDSRFRAACRFRGDRSAAAHWRRSRAASRLRRYAA